jgi:hypothetical protein
MGVMLWERLREDVEALYKSKAGQICGKFVRGESKTSRRGWKRKGRCEERKGTRHLQLARGHE